MASSTPNTILLKGCGIRKELNAAEAITPGSLVELASATTVQNHSTAGGAAAKAFAVENDLVGDGIDTNYSSGDRVQYEVLPAGAEVYALVAASATAIPVGSPVISDGDGTVAVYAAQDVDEGGSATYTIYADSIVGYALEAVDNSGGGSAVRIKIEVA